MKSKKVEMAADDFWNLRSAHERLAVESKDVREIVLCAKIRLENVVVSISRSDRPKKLCYEEDEAQMYAATRLLNSARDITNEIHKRGGK